MRIKVVCCFFEDCTKTVGAESVVEEGETITVQVAHAGGTHFRISLVRCDDRHVKLVVSCPKLAREPWEVLSPAPRAMYTLVNHYSTQFPQNRIFGPLRGLSVNIMDNNGNL